jgi:hypothetical protein
MAALLDRKGAEAFLEAHPDFYGSEKNAQLLQDWVNQHGGCGSARNFEIAYRVLSAAGKLERRPKPKPEPPRRPTLEERGIIDLRNVRVVREAVTPEDRAKYADKPYESDVARKKRDEALRLAAVRDRIARRQQPQ